MKGEETDDITEQKEGKKPHPCPECGIETWPKYQQHNPSRQRYCVSMLCRPCLERQTPPMVDFPRSMILHQLGEAN
jgi:hypothetical protein